MSHRHGAPGLDYPGLDLGFCCGAGGIRTPGSLARPAAFKAAAINRTLPPLPAGSPPSERPNGVRAGILLSSTPTLCDQDIQPAAGTTWHKLHNVPTVSPGGSGAGPPERERRRGGRFLSGGRPGAAQLAVGRLAV